MQAKDIVLGLLMQGPKSGYDIKQAYELNLSHFFDASYGSVYPTLKQLEKAGHIRKETIIQEGKPNKHVYSITDEGRQKFVQYLASPVQPDLYRSDVLARLYFGGFAHVQEVTGWLEETLELRQSLLQQLEAVYEESKTILSPPQMLSLQLGLIDYRSQICMFERAISYLKSGYNNGEQIESLHELEWWKVAK
ncbi:PadR family transcriptional regulator [Paenibacillus sp. 481]|uniref:PadR family transcriptional regulator n=1 Tax=Paenibacillus sp. 481 TaxID=2835869 RepID=UPI001E602DE7|nr:PadR family transcriptional regulator [Paenibacillus sp. 481]UHA75569.1 PadR family transcriptional regulator [Paenibacillus sp. 481]